MWKRSAKRDPNQNQNTDFNRPDIERLVMIHIAFGIVHFTWTLETVDSEILTFCFTTLAQEVLKK
jgi:hypothetical protein